MTKDQFYKLLADKKLDNPIPFKYVKGTQTWLIKGAPAVKIRLYDVTGFSESPWAAQSPDGKEYMLLNDAVAFMPYPSWGVILPSANINPTPIAEKGILTLHPEAWDSAVKQGALSPDGVLLNVDRFAL